MSSIKVHAVFLTVGSLKLGIDTKGTVNVLFIHYFPFELYKKSSLFEVYTLQDSDVSVSSGNVEK